MSFPGRSYISSRDFLISIRKFSKILRCKARNWAFTLKFLEKFPRFVISGLKIAIVWIFIRIFEKILPLILNGLSLKRASKLFLPRAPKTINSALVHSDIWRKERGWNQSIVLVRKQLLFLKKRLHYVLFWHLQIWNKT